MTTDERDVLSALLDREDVDADVLARVLEVPEHRRMLVDFVRLRAALRPDDATPPAETWPRRVPRGGRPYLLRAAAAAVLVGVGLVAGLWSAGRLPDADAPPAPSRVVRLSPVTTP